MIVKDEAVTSRSMCPCFIRCNSNFKIQDKNRDVNSEQDYCPLLFCLKVIYSGKRPSYMMDNSP